MFRHSSGRYEEYSVTKNDCGMKINTVLDRDEGEWQCKIHGKNPDTGNVEEVIGSIQLVIDQEDEDTSLRETSAPNPILEQNKDLDSIKALIHQEMSPLVKKIETLTEEVDSLKMLVGQSK